MKAQMKKEVAAHEPVKTEAAPKHVETVKPLTAAKTTDRDWLANPFPTMWHWFEDMERMMPDFGLMNRLAPRFYPPDLFRPAFRMMRETPLWNEMADMAAKWTPAAELVRRDNDLIVKLDLPGVKREDIKIDIEDNKLIVYGERHDEIEDKREGYYRSERTFGSFHRVIPLPENAKVDKADAVFDNGVLTISMEMPKAKPKAKRIEVAEPK